MKNVLIAGVVLAALGYLLYRRLFISPDGQPSNPIPQHYLGTLDMENIIEWFMSHQVAEFKTPSTLAVAVNLKTLIASTDPSSEFAAILSQAPREYGSHPEAILLGFFNKEKGELIPHPYAVVFTADVLTPILRNHFKDKAIFILE